MASNRYVLILIALFLLYPQMAFSAGERIAVLQKDKVFPDFSNYVGEILRTEGIVEFKLE
ncbi:hypothetical protein MYX84_10805 [Acidobacteria bacterium AH-259-O06]|nr:hypothetical protein [Acidobacteria bacterium AH-259-O06]